MSGLTPRPQRPPSPSNTTFSGISNYRTDSYRPIGKLPAVPSIDSRKIAKIHFDELQKFLGQHLAKEPLNSRSSAREKLTRLTKQQFQELSTDVYDELIRRNNNILGNEVPFLPVRDDFHPKRNQARQKLATLPKTRFKDLASDVFFELGRRYPEFKEPEVPSTPGSPPSNYDEVSSPDYRERGQPQPSPMNSSYPAPGSRRKPSREQNNFPSVPIDRRRPSQDLNGDFFSGADRRRPSEDTLRSTGRATPSGRRPSGDDAASGSNYGPAATATSGVVIPNKSTIAEERIEVPYGREDDAGDMRASRSTVTGDDNDEDRDGDRAMDSASVGFKSPTSPSGGLGGLSALTAMGKRQVSRKRDSDDDLGTGRSDSDYYDKSFKRASGSSDRPMRSGSRSRKQSNAGDEVRLRRDYELKIATMQSRINGLESDVADVGMRKAEGDDRARKLTGELEKFRSQAEGHSAAMLALKQDLDDARAAQARERESRRKDDEEEVRRLRERCERLENERDESQGAQNMELMEQLRSDLESVLAEANDLSNRNEELMAARDADSNIIRDLTAQVKEYKRKYEQAKTELRSVKATSQLYLQAPKQMPDDQLPVTPSGGLLDIHVTAFLSSIDLLLTAGRSSTPARVYAPTKAVVNAVHAILEDIRSVEARPRKERLDCELEDLQALRERADTTLSNLVVAARTHATSFGMSPVSLLDAAASHVSSAVTEIGKTIQVRKATKAEQDAFNTPTSPTGVSSSNVSALALRPVDEGGGGHMRTSSSASSARGEDYSSSGTRTNGRYREMSPTPRTGGRNNSSALARRPPSDPSSSNASSPPAIFDTPPGTNTTNGPGSDESAAPEGPDDAWAELKPYLEAQSESIVYAIQSVLSAVRSPAPSPNLNENLTQIITIVSSIVAVCKDSLPSASLKEGNDILRELIDHCNKLSEIQAMPEITKESRQAMAKSSFAVANAMKSLVKL